MAKKNVIIKKKTKLEKNMSLKAVEISLSEHEKRIITELKNGSHTPLHLKKRSEIIMRASAGESNIEISR